MVVTFYKISRWLKAILLASCLHAVYGQDLVQCSGIVYTRRDGQQIPLAYAEIGIVGTYRGTYSDDRGFYSFAVERGDSVVAHYIGYASKVFVVPHNLVENRYILNIELNQDTLVLEPALIYPWPSREHFRIEFLQMDVSDPMQEQAMRNLSAEALAALAPSVKADGQAGVSLYFADRANRLVYNGQFNTSRILDPLAWLQFIEAIKRGEFKKKKRKVK